MTKKQSPRKWSIEEKRAFCLQTTEPGVTIAEVARRNFLNDDMLYRWVKDKRFSPQRYGEAGSEFLPVEISSEHTLSPALCTSNQPSSRVQIKLTSGQKIVAEGAFDPEILAKLIKELEG